VNKKTKASLSTSSDLAVPPQHLQDILLEQYQKGQFVAAEQVANSITRKFPKHKLSWTLLGAIFGQTGRYVEALAANQKVLALSPRDAGAHYNLGITLKSLKKIKESESFVLTLQKDRASSENIIRRINIKKILQIYSFV